jgi:cell wall-associated NlpC family hydrolase/LysM repeat protein
VQRTNRIPRLAAGVWLPAVRLGLGAFIGGDVLARSRPRYLLHGSVAAIALVTVAALALTPRPVTPRAPVAASAATVDAPSPPLVDLSTDEPVVEAATAEPTAAPTEVEERVAPPKPFTHTVEEGETIRMLAARYSLNPATILSANRLSDPDLLQVGQDLTIPPTDGVLHTLRAGESIRRVADRYGIDAADIIKANDLGDNPDMVQAGTLLMVPGAEPVLPAAGRYAQTDDGDQQAAAIGGGAGLPIVPPRVTPSTRTYEVQSGDTLGSIADTFGVDVDTILSSNGIDDPDTIKPGSELRILPVKGLEYTVQPGETLADISYKYQVDLGLLLDYNDLNDPDVINVGVKLVVPGGKLRAEPPPAPVVEVPAARTGPGGAAVVTRPAAPAAPKPAAKPAASAPQPVVGRGGANIVANAMKYVGYRYVFGGTSPAGFDCSGFVYYIHNASGAPVGRGMWQQYNGGAHIPLNALQPGDTVFFANTYMAGLSHDGIYIGGGQFVHASDERTGVTISSINSSYWAGHYVGATRLWD